MLKENNEIFTDVVNEALVLKVLIGEGISKEDVIGLLHQIIIHIEQHQSDWNNAGASYFAVAEKEEGE